jgi:hypothetical protein
MPWQRFANLGVTREVRIPASLLVTIPLIFEDEFVCASFLLSCADNDCDVIKRPGEALPAGSD